MSWEDEDQREWVQPWEEQVFGWPEALAGPEYGMALDCHLWLYPQDGEHPFQQRPRWVSDR